MKKSMKNKKKNSQIKKIKINKIKNNLKAT